MASINTTVVATTEVAEETDVPPKPTIGNDVELEEEDESDEEEGDDGESEEESDWSGAIDFGMDEDEEEEDREGEDGEEEDGDEGREEEIIDQSDSQRWKDLPDGQYVDRAEKFDVGALLERAEKNQYGLLFRVSGPKTGQGSGGKGDPNINYGILNTEESVIPHRFARRHVEPGKQRGHSGLLKIPPTRLIRMLRHHTFGIKDGRSEVSSWTHCLLAAINFAEHVFKRDGTATIHIIDTTQFTNDIFHNADLRRAFGSKEPVNKLFPTEWIVHGIVDGPGYWVVNFRKIKNLLPLLRLTPARSNPFPHMGFVERQEINRRITAGQATCDLSCMSETCNTVATVMMETYKAQDTPTAKTIHLRLRAMLYCLRPRWTRQMLQTGLTQNSNQSLIKAIGDLTPAPALQEHPDIINDDVFTHEDFPDVTQARALLRMLAISREAARQVDEASRKALKRKREDS